jgi:hypothetical protein
VLLDGAWAVQTPEKRLPFMERQFAFNKQWNEQYEAYWSALLKVDRHRISPTATAAAGVTASSGAAVKAAAVPMLPSPIVLSSLFTCPNPGCKSRALDSIGYCRLCRTHLRAGGMVPAVVPDFWKNDAAWAGLNGVMLP